LTWLFVDLPLVAPHPPHLLTTRRLLSSQGATGFQDGTISYLLAPPLLFASCLLAGWHDASCCTTTTSHSLNALHFINHFVFSAATS
jgi:hypothetical protein